MIVYSSSACVFILLYYYFAADEGCDRNRWFILINVVACIIASVVGVVKQGENVVKECIFRTAL